MPGAFLLGFAGRRFGGMREVVIHPLGGTKKAHEACRLIEMLYESGRRVVAWVGDSGRAATFNEYLWTFAQHSFVPHALATDAADVDDPVVVVTGELSAPNGADVLVVVDALADCATAEGFAEIHDFVSQSPEDAGKRAAWELAGFHVVAPGGSVDGGR
jgi:DNA polymerase IIIc chi subunit